MSRLTISNSSTHAARQYDSVSLLFRQAAYFLANVNSRSRSLYADADPSVVCLSVMLVRPTQPVEIFGNFFYRTIAQGL